MANAIQLSKNYVPNLDEVYAAASVTAVLDSDAGCKCKRNRYS